MQVPRITMRYIKTRLLTVVKTVVKYVGMILIIPCILNSGIHVVAYFQDPLNEEEALGILKKESSVLGIKHKVHLQSIDGALSRNLLAIALKHPTPGEYIIAFDSQSLKEAVIRHELVHIAVNGDNLRLGGETIHDTIQKLDSFPRPGFFRSMYNYLIPEEIANLYALTGIRFF